VAFVSPQQQELFVMADINRDGVDDGRVVERTTVVNTDGGSGSGAVIAVVLLIALLALAWMFRDSLGFSGSSVPEKIEVKVDSE
jgi:hypothetical protein